jgi:predicted DsbA family dithiol-disulfide isomerase
MKIEIWSDIACPWCYVGKRRFESALQRFEHRDAVDVVWRSFELDTTAPREHGEPQAELLAKKYGMPVEQARAMNARMAGEAKKEGLDFDFDIAKPGNTFDAHRLIHLAATAGKREAVVERFFKAYLGEGASMGDHETLVRLASEVGVDADAARRVLASDEYADEVRADEQRARGFGINGVPFFAIDEKYGVSGAQPPEAILEVLQQAYAESALTMVGPKGDGCEDGSCAI